MIRSKNEKEIEDACFCAGRLTPRPYTSYLNWRTVSLDAGSCFLTADSSETLRRGATKRTPLSEQRNTHLLTILIKATKMAARNSPALAMTYYKEKQRGNANRATLTVPREMVAYMVAVDRRQNGFLVINT